MDSKYKFHLSPWCYVQVRLEEHILSVPSGGFGHRHSHRGDGLRDHWYAYISLSLSIFRLPSLVAPSLDKISSLMHV